MGCPDRIHFHYAISPWRLAEVAQQDVEPAPCALSRDHRTWERNERHFALPVVGQSGVLEGPPLGVLAIRCERHGQWVLPLKLAIVDHGPVTVDSAMAQADDGA